MEISKEQIIQALETEPLKAGEWASPDGLSDQPCEVCAVGAVLRAANWSDDRIRTEAVSLVGNCFIGSDNTESALGAGNYLGALSSYFERIYPKSGATHETRAALVRFVKEYFPPTINIKD